MFHVGQLDPNKISQIEFQFLSQVKAMLVDLWYKDDFPMRWVKMILFY